ncbi:hypothetical protein ABIA39_000518 [Nocardia sp. GAS34]
MLFGFETWQSLCGFGCINRGSAVWSAGWIYSWQVRWFLVLLAGSVLLTGCTSAPVRTPPPVTTTTPYARTPGDCAKLTVTPLVVQPGIGYVIGTHAEWDPKGQFVRIRVAITNSDATYHTTRTSDYRLLDAAGAEYPTSVDAMRIKRQPDAVEIGAGDRLEVELWYDIPTTTTARSLRDTVCGTVIQLTT